MPKVFDIDLKKKAQLMLFVGRSSSGKTAAAATYPRPLIQDYDGRVGGLISMRKIIEQSNPAGVDYKSMLPPFGWQEVSKEFKDLKLNIIMNQGSGYTGPKTLIPDSITAMNRLFINESLDIQSGLNVKDPQKSVGIRLEGTGDYKYESSAFFQILDWARELVALGMNVIFTAHILDRYGKPGKHTFDAEGKPHLAETWTAEKEKKIDETVVVGEQLSIRPKIGENLMVYFDEVYRFEKREIGNQTRHFVKFKTDIARSSLGLQGEHDITGVNFYQFWLEQVGKI